MLFGGGTKMLVRRRVEGTVGICKDPDGNFKSGLGLKWTLLCQKTSGYTKYKKLDRKRSDVLKRLSDLGRTLMRILEVHWVQHGQAKMDITSPKTSGSTNCKMFLFEVLERMKELSDLARTLTRISSQLGSKCWRKNGHCRAKKKKQWIYKL